MLIFIGIDFAPSLVWSGSCCHPPAWWFSCIHLGLTRFVAPPSRFNHRLFGSITAWFAPGFLGCDLEGDLLDCIWGRTFVGGPLVQGASAWMLPSLPEQCGVDGALARAAPQLWTSVTSRSWNNLSRLVPPWVQSSWEMVFRHSSSSIRSSASTSSMGQLAQTWSDETHQVSARLLSIFWSRIYWRVQPSSYKTVCRTMSNSPLVHLFMVGKIG